MKCNTSTKTSLEIHYNTVWKLSVVEEYIFFYNSETEFLKTIIQSADGSYFECNKVRGEIVRNFGPALWIDFPTSFFFLYRRRRLYDYDRG